MPKKIYTEEEARERKNARQREYSKRTGYKANNEYNKRTYKQYTFSLRMEEDADVIDYIARKKDGGNGIADIIRMLVREKNK